MRRKTIKRSELLEVIALTLQSPNIYEIIDYRNQREDKIKQFMYPYLVESIAKLYRKRFDVDINTAVRNARKMILWEGNVNTTITNELFMGTQHRPDMVVVFDGLRIAIEIKRGCAGTSVREALGQGLVYSNLFDFVVCLYIDTSKEKKILNASTSVVEKKFISKLWKKHNILFTVV